ncbi:hypothetical protein RND81_01G113400 [Saponaria officinalis]|uniref:Uncharacterized protein n=1 Tax=Saponaria officinalis TaxID=3572 RepID=A0AAW1NEE4_SAPOF
MKCGLHSGDSRYQAQHSVFNNEDLMNKIFNFVKRRKDKANIVMVCRNWCQLFMFHRSAPRLELAFRRSLRINDVNGVRIIRRGSRIIYQRCKCFMTLDFLAKVVLHYKQSKNRFQRSHLNVLDAIEMDRVRELLFSPHDDNWPYKMGNEIASMILLRESVSYRDLPTQMDV